MRATYVAAVVLSAALLMLAQPMAAKALLPRLGGTPAVWNTCMVFFQVLLLLGYAWAHLVGKLPGRGRQVVLHGALLVAAVLALPIGLAEDAAPAGAPIRWILASLAGSVGLPLFAVAATSPLLQRWFAGTDDSRPRDPYFLYAVGNAGSLGALLAYPVLVEATLPLAAQERTWSLAFAVLAVLVVACGALGRPRQTAPAQITPRAEQGTRLGVRRVLLWVVLALVPSSLMLGATHHVTTDVATVPFLWVVPLALYLFTFVLAFSPGRIIRPALAEALLAVLTVIGLVAFAFWWYLPAAATLALHLTLLFVAAFVCHGRLAESRPPASQLTGFYLAIATGGALGGAFNALVAPHLFDFDWEYPLAIAGAFLLRRRRKLPFAAEANPWTHRALDVVILVLALVYVPWNAWNVTPSARIVHMERSFFGIHRVLEGEQGRWRRYHQGSTIHGIQLRDAPRAPTSYYHEGSGVGRALGALAGDERRRRVGLVGLGMGTLAAYGAPGERFTFFEIDPTVVRIARDAGFFTFLQDSRADVDVVLGDGRLSLAAVPDASFGVLVFDVFSSDAIPVHLLTVEAFRLYLGKLQEDGLLIMHVTNRHVDVRRLVGATAARLGLIAIEWGDAAEESVEQARYGSDWVVLARDEGALAPLLREPGWRRLPEFPDTQVFTDDWSNLLALVQWIGRFG